MRLRIKCRDAYAFTSKDARDEFHESLRGLVNPYGAGNASRLITDRLRTVELGDRLIRKKFYDLPIDLENDAEERPQESHTTI